MTIPAKLLQLQQRQNDVMAMLALLYSKEGLEIFSDMAADRFTIAWGELTAEEARAILFLLNVADQIHHVATEQPESLILMPHAAFKGFSNLLLKLSPYRELLHKVEAVEVSPFEAKILGGDIAIRQGEGNAVTVEQLNTLLADAA